MNLPSQTWLNRTSALLMLAIAIPAQGWYERYIYENQLNPITRQGFCWVHYTNRMATDAQGYEYDERYKPGN